MNSGAGLTIARQCRVLVIDLIDSNGTPPGMEWDSVMGNKWKLIYMLIVSRSPVRSVRGNKWKSDIY